MIGPSTHRMNVPFSYTGCETSDSDKPTSDYWESEEEDGDKISQIDTDELSAEESVSEDDSNDDNFSHRINVIDLLPRPRVQKDPDKQALSEKEIERRLSSFKFGPKVNEGEKVKFLKIF